MLIAILISAVGVMNSILMAVFERSQEIGMMRAVGASHRDIFRIILEETTILSLGGGLIGIVISILCSNVKGMEMWLPRDCSLMDKGRVDM